MYAIVDYGMGNLRSVQKAFEKIGTNAVITESSKDLDSAEKIILPGVGAFQDAIDELQKRELVEPLLRNIKKGKLFLGICLGLHLLFDKSYEDGEHEGLGLIPGNVVKFTNRDSEINDKKERLKIPHMGWNRVCFQQKDNFIFKDIPDETYMYFVHSYYVSPVDSSVVIGRTDYGLDFASIVCKDNIYATQFHPEKSHERGLQLLKNFVEMKC